MVFRFPVASSDIPTSHAIDQHTNINSRHQLCLPRNCHSITELFKPYNIALVKTHIVLAKQTYLPLTNCPLYKETRNCLYTNTGH